MAQVYLGFDYGTKRIGTAVGQAITKTATPQKCILTQKGEPDWQAIASLIKLWEPSALVIGLPYNMDGSEQRTTTAARAFAQALQQRFQLPTHLVDERLTTKDVRQQLFEEGGYAKIQRADIDSLSAKLILEQWMRTQ
jgi:putative Holliday junction resolvase